jgi:hypothetical protein
MHGVQIAPILGFPCPHDDTEQITVDEECHELFTTALRQLDILLSAW